MDIEHDILMALRRITRAIDLHSHELAREHGLTGPQLLLMKQIAAAPEGMAVSALARALALAQPTVTGILARLERDGLVHRARATSDRRCVIATLTRSGRKALAAAPPLLQERFLREMRALPAWERTAILSVLQRVVSLMGAESLDAAPVLTRGALQSPETPGGAGQVEAELQP